MPFQTVAIDGGLDLVTAPQAVQPGRLTDCSNYEVARQRGVRVIDGYEPYDGGPSPSSTVYLELQLNSFNGTPGVQYWIFDNSVRPLTTIYLLIAVANDGAGANTWFFATGVDINGNPAVLPSASTIGNGNWNFTNTFGSFLSTIDAAATVVSVATNNQADLTARQTFFNLVAPTIQPVPGQASVNGLFWLKDTLYATRDYLAATFTTGTTQPQIGDVLFQGASLGAATWTGQLQKIVLTSGAWSDATNVGNAAGTLTFYNTTGTLTAATLNNNTHAASTIATVTAFGATVASPSAGLYWASGQRGATVATDSWQWCDLGWTIQYNNGVVEFIDMNLALTELAGLSTQYITTGWKTSTSASGVNGASQGGWNVSGGTFPGVLTSAGDTQYLFQFTNQSSYNKKPTPFTLTGFGFTDADVPPTASLTGIEIQFVSGAVNLSGSNGPVVDGTFQLVGVLNGATPSIANTTTSYALTLTTTNTNTAQYSTYIFSTRDTGAPTTSPAPTSLLGYYGIQPSDIKRPVFGITYTFQDTVATSQSIQFGIDQVRMRVSYLPQTNGIYFWNGITHTDGAMSLSGTTLTAATSVPFSAADVGKTISVNGAGVAGAKLVTTIASFTDSSHVVLATAASTAVSGATFNYGTAVLANVVQHYKQSGAIATSNEAGTLYYNFVTNGVVGGIPVRPIGSGEQIRSAPIAGLTPDGGANDGSQLIASTSSAMDMNQMDPTSTLNGAPQPDGSLAPASKYQSVTKNFYASSGLEAIYGVSGGGPAFYFDGVKVNAAGTIVAGNFARILTGLPLQFETPRSIVYHQGHIVLGYYSGVIQWSNGANVLSFDPTLYDETAADNGFGERVTAMASINGDSLAIWTQSTIQMMQGNFNIPAGNATVPALYTSTLAPTSGGIEYTVQPMSNYMYADFRGITMLGATQKYGDFEIGHVSSEVTPFLIPRLQLSKFFESSNIGIINSVLIRNKNMAKYFFADGAAMSLTFLADGENPQFTIQNYTNAAGSPMTWDVIEAFTESLGRDRIFGATADGTGNVFEVDRGNSFNGAAIAAHVTLVPDTGQVAYQNKKFSGINVFGQAQDYGLFNLSRSAGYVTPVAATGNNIITGTFGSLTAFPTGLVKPYRSITTSALQIEGSAVNLRFDYSSNQQFSHTIQAVSYTIDPLETKQQ